LILVLILVRNDLEEIADVIVSVLKNNAATSVLIPGFFRVAKNMISIGDPRKENMNIAYVSNLPHVGMADISAGPL